MFGTAAGILYLGHKKATPNTILWTLFPLIRGFHWLIEFFADYYEEILDIEMPILDRLEIFTAFCSSIVLLAACIEYNGIIRRHIGKIIVFLGFLIPLYLILTVDFKTLEEIEDIELIKGDIVSTELARFTYGFILPLLSIIAIILTFLYYYYQTTKDRLFYNPKILKTSLILVILIFLFSIFEGFDYFEDQGDIEAIFEGLRAVTLSFFIILPLIIIISSDLGLQRFFIIEQSGLPIFIYNFQTKESAISEELSFLTSGFLTAIINFSDELSTRKGGFLSIRSRYLYYSILKTEGKLYAIQSILYNKNLENAFFSAAKQIDNLVSELNKNLALDAFQVKEVLDKNFSIFY